MKRFFYLLCVISIVFFTGKSQSTIEFQSGTNIEVTTGADICADNIIINGTYSGDGTQCGGVLPVELVSFTAVTKGNVVELAWETATEVNNYGFEIERKQIPLVPLGHSPFTKGETNEASGGFEKIGFVAGSGTTNSPISYSFVDGTAKGSVIYRLKQIDNDGMFEYSQEVTVEVSTLPQKFALMQNYPNPFNPSTAISYSLPEQSSVKVTIYDMQGREINSFMFNAQSAGFQKVMWDGRNNRGEVVSSGTYLCEVKASSMNGGKMFEKTVKMTLVK